MKKGKESYQKRLKRVKLKEASNSRVLFENLPELIVPELAAEVLGKSVKTLYDWNYRGQMRKKKVPHNLFIKIGGGLYMRRDTLIEWVSSRDSS